MRRKHTGCHDGLRQGLGVFSDLEGRQAADDCKPLLYLRWIAERGFIDYDLVVACERLFCWCWLETIYRFAGGSFVPQPDAYLRPQASELLNQ
jgi:hypothetical protein